MVAVFLNQEEHDVFLAVVFQRKPCAMQWNIESFKHMLCLMSYLSFVSCDIVEAILSSLQPLLSLQSGL